MKCSCIQDKVFRKDDGLLLDLVGYKSPCRDRAAEPEVPSQKIQIYFFLHWGNNISIIWF